MSKIYLEEVAKILGVELGEPFKLTDDIHGDYYRYYQFTDKKGLETSVDGVKWETATAIVLRGILMGDIRIVKLPWKPRKCEKYYIPYISTKQKGMYVSYYWTDDDINIEHYRMRLVCKTPEEAIALTKKMLAVAKEVRNDG